MAQVTVTVAGRAYRIACDDGEEEKLGELGLALEARVGELRSSLGEVGDLRLLVMAAITCLDELSEREAEIRQLRAELNGESAASTSAAAAIRSSQAGAAQCLVEVAERLESLARDLSEDTRQ